MQQRLVFAAKIWLLTIVSYFLLRIAFGLAYHPSASNYSFSQLALAFLLGLRFDNAIFFILNLLPLLMLFLPIQQRRYLFITNITLYWVFCYALVSSVAGFVYFAVAQKHPTIELQLLFREFSEVFVMLVTYYWHVLLFFLVIIWLSWKLWRRFLPMELLVRSSFHWRQSLVAVPVLLLIAIVSIRGGFQTRPLRASMAFQNEDMFLGNLALNGVYTSVTALLRRDQLPVPRPVDSGLIAAVQQRLLAQDEQAVSPDYPLLRQASNRQFKPLNIVVFIMESWSAADVGALGGRGDVTPFFDSIAAKGLLFTEAYATNTRSIQSLPSVISSIPSVYGVTYIISAFQANNQRGLGAIYAAKGYNSYFAYAARSGSMGFDSYARQAGFRKIITRESFPSETPQDGAWGIFDDITFLKMHELFAAEEKPFVAVIYSLHPHPPYKLPEGRTKITAEKRAEFYSAMRFSDDALAAFFAQARQAPYFRDTIFVITADHAFEQKPGSDSFRIPLLFYSPAHIKPGRNERIASQLDILPSLLHLTGISEPYAAAGKSLFGNTAAFAVFERGNLMGYMEGDYVIFADAEKPVGLYQRKQDPDFQTNLISAQPELARLLGENYFRYISVVNRAILKNRLAPVF